MDGPIDKMTYRADFQLSSALRRLKEIHKGYFPNNFQIATDKITFLTD